MFSLTSSYNVFLHCPLCLIQSNSISTTPDPVSILFIFPNHFILLFLMTAPNSSDSLSSALFFLTLDVNLNVHYWLHSQQHYHSVAMKAIWTFLSFTITAWVHAQRETSDAFDLAKAINSQWYWWGGMIIGGMMVIFSYFVRFSLNNSIWLKRSCNVLFNHLLL